MKRNKLDLFCVILMYCFALTSPIASSASAEIEQFDRLGLSLPSWYGNLIASDFQLVGYGLSSSSNQAKANALSDISEQISINVTSNTSISTKQLDGRVRKAQSREVSVSSSKKITQAKLIKQEYWKGQYFQAWQVDMRSSSNILAEKIHKKYGYNPANIIWKAHPLVRNSQFVKDLTTRIQGKSNQTLTLSVSLDRKHSSWVITLDNIVHNLDDSEILELVNWPLGSEVFDIALITQSGNQSNRLKANDLFSLEISAKQPEGYLSVYNIYSDGRVTLLQDNRKLQETQKLSDSDGPFVLEAQPSRPNQVDYDTYLAVWSKNKLNNTKFQQQKEQMIDGQASYRLDELLTHIQNPNIIEIATLSIEITP